jgi:hypothetical protein
MSITRTTPPRPGHEDEDECYNEIIRCARVCAWDMFCTVARMSPRRRKRYLRRRVPEMATALVRRAIENSGDTTHDDPDDEARITRSVCEFIRAFFDQLRRREPMPPTPVRRRLDFELDLAVDTDASMGQEEEKEAPCAATPAPEDKRVRMPPHDDARQRLMDAVLYDAENDPGFAQWGGVAEGIDSIDDDAEWGVVDDTEWESE